MRDAAKEEARVQSERSKAWGARLDRLKATCALVMESIPFPAGKPKKLEGRTGALYLKANGGKQAVEVTDESLVPDELCTVTVTMPMDVWKNLCGSAAPALKLLEAAAPQLKLSPRVPSLSLILSRLSDACPKCNGACSHSGDGTQGHIQVMCPECGGSGHQLRARSAAGARESCRSEIVMTVVSSVRVRAARKHAAGSEWLREPDTEAHKRARVRVICQRQESSSAPIERGIWKHRTPVPDANWTPWDVTAGGRPALIR